jgi:hypothetical protein
MITTGILRVSSGISRLNGTRLAIVDDTDPFGAATDFLANLGLSNNDFIWVNGNNDFVGSVPVIDVINAGPMAPAIVGATTALTAGARKSLRAAAKESAGRKGGAKKSAKKSAKKPAKKPAKKSAVKKSGKGSRKRQ